MRPPRVAILVLFCSASFFLVCRSISSIRRPGLATASSPKASLRTLFPFTAPFSLFPPSAAISLTDDNSTFFPARPAAFGPPLHAKGLSGQLWIGSGFSDDTLQDGESEGELGCSDIPGWEDERSGLAIKAAVQGPSSSKSDTLALAANGPKTNKLGVDPAAGQDPAPKAQRQTQPKAVNDGTDNHLHQALQQTRGPFNEGSTTSGSSHADIQSIQETAEITGKVALLSRGGCGFLEKVKWAQRRGAIALIVGDNQRGGPLIQMFARGNVDNVTIPSVFTSRTTAHLLSSLMQPGSFIEDILSGNGDPLLNVQRSAKGGRSKIVDKPTSSARRASQASAEETPARGNINAKTKKSTTTRINWVSLLFRRRDSRGSSLSGPVAERNMAPDSKVSPLGNIRSTSSVADPAGPESGAPRSVPGPRRGLFSKLSSGKTSHSSSEIQRSPATAPASVSPVPGDNNNSTREGLWVTITPNSSANPFFDTLLVLVISPLITLTVVYALLILRVKIRMRRWRAPMSVVDQLPVRTYHTVGGSPPRSPRTPSPTSSSPTTPLLQSSSGSRPRPRTTAGVADSSDLLGTDDALQTTRPPSPEKNTRGGSSEWKKYMGRQVECVVCLEEYVDGVSRVMSLPCGHEFHAECITPWLTTRRRTCPICKNDVVRSLARGTSSGPRYEPFREDSYDSTGEASDMYQYQDRIHSPNPLMASQIDDIERGPSTRSRPMWYAHRYDSWYNALTVRLGRNSAFPTNREGSGEDRGR